MKKRKIKGAVGLFVLSLTLFLFTPINVNAQGKKAGHYKAKKGKVVVQKKNQHNHNNSKVIVQVNRAPNRYTVIPFRNTNYQYRNGVFYRPSNGNYIATVPPIGIRVRTLPPNPFRFVLGGKPFYYNSGTYYAASNQGGYEVVGAPVGAIVKTLPAGYEVFELDGKVYYRLNDTYYKAVLESNGNVAYQVIRM